jgi:uncharacterized membrane protein
MPDIMSWMMVGSFIFWAIVVVLAFVLVWRIAWPRSASGDPRAILAERLARGEISVEEYRTTLALLSA